MRATGKRGLVGTAFALVAESVRWMRVVSRRAVSAGVCAFVYGVVRRRARSVRMRLTKRRAGVCEAPFSEKMGLRDLEWFVF